MRRRRSHWRLALGGGLVIAAAFAVALVERYRMPKGTIWIVVGVAALLAFLVRVIGRNE
ncbi:MAG TPA: hypothetical protein VMQ51_10825 [Candidatus Binatia bacterium]|nr:hypothetical protein [Candidatus Binatia bacterium]